MIGNGERWESHTSTLLVTFYDFHGKRYGMVILVTSWLFVLEQSYLKKLGFPFPRPPQATAPNYITYSASNHKFEYKICASYFLGFASTNLQTFEVFDDKQMEKCIFRERPAGNQEHARRDNLLWRHSAVIRDRVHSALSGIDQDKFPINM